MSYYPHDTAHLSRRLVAFVAILIVHAIVIWGFISGFANESARYVQTILETNIIQTEKPKELPPPPPPVDLKERPPVQMIAPEINITIPVEPPAPRTTPPSPPTGRNFTRKPPAVTARKAGRSSRSVSMWPARSTRLRLPP